MTEPTNPISEQEQPATVVLTQEEYDDIIAQLEGLAGTPQQREEDYHMMIFSKIFWDNFITKLIATLVSVKMWVLFTLLYWPYQLVRQGYITGSNYTTIILVVAPLVVGLREFAKVGSNSKIDPDASTPNAAQRLLSLIRSRFHV